MNNVQCLFRLRVDLSELCIAYILIHSFINSVYRSVHDLRLIHQTTKRLYCVAYSVNNEK